MKMKNSKLKISEFEKYSLTKKFQTLIKGGLTDGGDDDLGGYGGDGDDPGTGGSGGPGGSTTVGVATVPPTPPIVIIPKN